MIHETNTRRAAAFSLAKLPNLASPVCTTRQKRANRPVFYEISIDAGAATWYFDFTESVKRFTINPEPFPHRPHPLLQPRRRRSHEQRPGGRQGKTGQNPGPCAPQAAETAAERKLAAVSFAADPGRHHHRVQVRPHVRHPDRVPRLQSQPRHLGQRMGRV